MRTLEAISPSHKGLKLSGKWYSTTDEIIKQIKEAKLTFPVDIDAEIINNKDVIAVTLPTASKPYAPKSRGEFRNPEQVSRDRAIEFALKMFELNKVENFSEIGLINSAKVFARYIITGEAEEIAEEEVIEGEEQ